ncbi:hypothetical protein D0869_02662 [Hortaea werneckii]|uniref:DUF155 domain-containing protein n=2 Tax=Hortaea werneckii TaxID=91943 RepID=A0A3M7AZZ2_HORWE|nr:hypothetical protein D0869_02662 [Hortaea werneckii]RMY24405.1 hypothetical protein D0867_01399 [Hortaea werneckii]RMY33093.1 hypothetical protein D0866_06164 [Hortaea werneckii]
MSSARQTWIAFGTVVRGSIAAQSRSSRQQTYHNYPRRALQQAVLDPTRSSFSTCTRWQQDDSNKKTSHDGDKSKTPKRKAARSQASSNSLPSLVRRVAVEAQRSRKVIKGSGRRAHVDPEIQTRDVTAYCAAETYNLHVAKHVLQQEGYEPDPFRTELFPQVLHVQTPNFVVRDEMTGEDTPQGAGDVFIFPSGSVVTWNVTEKLAHHLVERTLAPKAAEEGHLDRLEVEDLAYVEDPTREVSKIIGDTIILGTKASSEHQQHHNASQSELDSNEEAQQQRRTEIDNILAKIAFSSALARSTKLAVLENMLSSYFQTTRSIPLTLSQGSKLRFSREFILRKTGELLHIRAQLNLYSELTDSLPDLFWDSPHELGLENYYEQVGRALDVGVRIKTLNERMNYASEIAAVLRERLSEKHSNMLEIWIIVLIVMEVLLEGYRFSHEWVEGKKPDSTEALQREWLKRELGSS